MLKKKPFRSKARCGERARKKIMQQKSLEPLKPISTKRFTFIYGWTPPPFPAFPLSLNNLEKYMHKYRPEKKVENPKKDKKHIKHYLPQFSVRCFLGEGSGVHSGLNTIIA